MTCSAGCEEDRGWREAIGSDGGFENRVQLRGPVVRKRYRRPDRFDSERTALGVFGPAGLAPEVLGICETHLCLTIRRVPGSPLDPEAADSALWHRFGTLVRELHHQGSGYARHRNTIDTFDERISSLPAPFRPAVVAWRARSRVDAVPAYATLLHGDLKPANVLVARQPRLIDFDQSRVGHPLSDLGKVSWRAAPVGTRAWDEFSEGYFGAAPSRADLSQVETFRVRHAIGALAYWSDFHRPAFATHARSAVGIVAAAIDADAASLRSALGLGL